MRKIWLAIFVWLILVPQSAMAIFDPLSVPNNRFGVHILEPSEITAAAKLVNSTGGDWGYVTIPIRSNDRDQKKWLEFFKNCRDFHIIPIIRLTTYVYNDTWVTPSAYDLVDFANFLSEMPWPTKNRYIILFNEPNHSKEWGGKVDPSHYATILIQAKSIFKSRSEDYFLLTAGLDASAPTNHSSLAPNEYYRRMTIAQPNWSKAVDGFSFHTYPNPAFSASVFSTDSFGILSYVHELKYLSRLKISTKPIFITETGNLNSTSDFYVPAFTKVWTDAKIVAITPFLLFAGSGDFAQFSLLDSNHGPTKRYNDILNLPKIPGSPLLPSSFAKVQSPKTQGSPAKSAPLKSFIDRIKNFFSGRTNTSSPTLSIGSTTISVEVAKDALSRTKGLSGRKSLPDNSGMLFVFQDSQPQSFWMFGMNFSLDFIWISDSKVVELTQDVPPPSKTHGVPTVINPVEPADQVLEVTSGFIERHGIKVGDEVEFRP